MRRSRLPSCWPRLSTSQHETCECVGSLLCARSATVAKGQGVLDRRFGCRQGNSERASRVSSRRHRQSRETGKKDTSSEIDYFTQGLGNFQDNADVEAMFSDDASESDDEEERQFTEKLRAKQTMLTSLQIEALWKVAKIDLDKVILAACRLILTQQYFFPSHQTMDVQNGSSSHGWVTITGRVMDAKEALQRTAEALIFLGDIMVERSKVETAWKE